MSLVGFIVLLVIGALCGIVAEMIVGFSVGGFLSSIAVGFLGAFIGTWLAPVVHLPHAFVVTVERYSFDVVWAILGAVLLLLVVSVFRRRSRAYYV